MALKHTINAFVYKGETHYLAECFDIAVVTQGKSLDDTIANLQEAVALHLEGEDLAEFGVAPNPTLLVTLELVPALDVHASPERIGTVGLA